jgi:hypothetical protein
MIWIVNPPSPDQDKKKPGHPKNPSWASDDGYEPHVILYLGNNKSLVTIPYT